MSDRRTGTWDPTRRRVLQTTGLGVAGLVAGGLGVLRWPPAAAQGDSRYFPPPESAGGWRPGDARTLGVNPDRLRDAVRYHDESPLTTSHGGALVVIHQGYVIAESYTTGAQGPQPWTAATCNDIKSSTKSVFGTAVGVFLDEHKERVSLESPLSARHATPDGRGGSGRTSTTACSGRSVCRAASATTSTATCRTPTTAS